MGALGDYIQTLAIDTFGKKVANLTNRQLKNAFDVAMQQAFGVKGKFPEQYSFGYSTQSVRKGGTKAIQAAEQAKATLGGEISNLQKVADDIRQMYGTEAFIDFTNKTKQGDINPVYLMETKYNLPYTDEFKKILFNDWKGQTRKGVTPPQPKGVGGVGKVAEGSLYDVSKLPSETQQLLNTARQRLQGFNEAKIMEYAQKISKANGNKVIQPQDLAEALQYREPMPDINQVRINNLLKGTKGRVKNFSGNEKYQRLQELGITDYLDPKLPKTYQQVSEKVSQLPTDSKNLLKTFIDSFILRNKKGLGEGLTISELKQIDNVVNVADKIKTLSGETTIQPQHLAEAMQYRNLPEYIKGLKPNSPVFGRLKELGLKPKVAQLPISDMENIGGYQFIKDIKSITPKMGTGKFEIGEVYQGVGGKGVIVAGPIKEGKVPVLAITDNGYELPAAYKTSGLKIPTKQLPLGEVSNKNIAGVQSLTGQTKPTGTLPSTKKEVQIPQPKIVDIQQATQERATVKSALSGGGFKGMADDVKDMFRTWVNKRQASKLEGYIKKQEFKDLDKKGMEGIFEFQSGQTEGRLSDLRKYFDQRYDDIQKSGLELNYKKNYLTQIWANPTNEVEAVFGRRLGLRPSFTFEQLVKDYKTGIELGLTPKFNTLSDIAGWYEGRVSKALADREFFDALIKDGMISPSGKSPMDWITLDPDTFPKFSSRFGKEKYYKGTYSAPPEMAKLINNYLRQPEGVLTDIANYASKMKNIVLTAGIPKTAINFHGVNILARHAFSYLTNPAEMVKSLYYMVRPSAAKQYVTKNLEMAKLGAQHGLQLSSEGFSLDISKATIKKTLGEKTIGKLLEKQNQWFEKPLFNEVIPSLKLKHFTDTFNGLRKSTNLSIKDAARKAADITNGIYGGINFEQMGKSRSWQDFLRATILAPDWVSTQFHLAKNLPKSVIKLGNPELKAYRKIVTNLTALLVTADIVNKVSSGHHMWENDSGHTFEIEMGYTSDGKKRYIKPFGTAADFIRIPYDVVGSLRKGDPTQVFRVVKNRLSVPASVAMGLLSNVDYRGRPIYGKDTYGRPLSPTQSVGGIVGELSRLGTPPQIKAGIDIASGRIGKEEFVSQFIELPTRYKGGSPIQLLATKTLKSNATTRKQLIKEAVQKGIITKDNYKDFQKEYDFQEMGLGEEERLLLRMQVKNGDRAKAVIKKLKSIKDQTERKEYFMKLVKAKIITKDVINSLE